MLGWVIVKCPCCAITDNQEEEAADVEVDDPLEEDVSVNDDDKSCFLLVWVCHPISSILCAIVL